jgi:hypothetical protein
MSSGTDQILGTDDDLIMSLDGTMLNTPAQVEASGAAESESGYTKTSSGRSLDMIAPAGSGEPEPSGPDDTSVRIP